MILFLFLRNRYNLIAIKRFLTYEILQRLRDFIPLQRVLSCAALSARLRPIFLPSLPNIRVLSARNRSSLPSLSRSQRSRDTFPITTTTHHGISHWRHSFLQKTRRLRFCWFSVLLYYSLAKGKRKYFDTIRYEFVKILNSKC